MNLDEFENALDDFNNVLRLEPNNKAAKNQSLSCSQKIESLRKPQTKGIYNRLALIKCYLLDMDLAL